jgi:hypothetical protein
MASTPSLNLDTDIATARAAVAAAHTAHRRATAAYRSTKSLVDGEAFQQTGEALWTAITNLNCLALSYKCRAAFARRLMRGAAI